jgi:hypothetical protein
MYLDDPESFTNLHLVVPSLGRSASFAHAGEQLFPTGTAGVLGIELPADYDTRPLLAILNSPLMSTFALAHSPIYQGSFHKFSKPYVDHLPIRKTPSDTGIWERLGELWGTRSSLPTGPHRDVVDTRIGDLVKELYQVTDSELAALVKEVEPLSLEDDPVDVV